MTPVRRIYMYISFIVMGDAILDIELEKVVLEGN